jgi:hypothetical protein
MRLTNLHTSSTCTGRFLALTRLLGAACALSMPLLAGDAGGGGPDRAAPPGSGSSGGTVAGDETIGTLPQLGPDMPFDLVRFVMDQQANVFLQGHRADVLSAIVHVRGATVATLRVLDATNDIVRFTFHGTPQLVLDRAALESGALQIGVRAPQTYGSGSIEVALGGRTLSSADFGPGALRLPVGELAASGLLDRRTLSTHAANSSGARTTIVTRAVRGVVVVEQAH